MIYTICMHALTTLKMQVSVEAFMEFMMSFPSSMPCADLLPLYNDWITANARSPRPHDIEWVRVREPSASLSSAMTLEMSW